jgi:hypothetical protein
MPGADTIVRVAVRRVRAGAGLCLLATALAAAGCGTGGPAAKDTRGGLAGRMSPACADTLAHVESSSAARIASLAGLVRAHDDAEATRRRIRPALLREQALAVAARKALARVRSPFDRFLETHPEHTLAHRDYVTYQALKLPVDASIRSFDHAVDTANATVGRYNRAIGAANAANRAANRLIAAEDAAGKRSEATETRCLGHIADWALAVARIERRLAPAARSAGKVDASVSCDSPGDWAKSGDREPGYEREGYVLNGQSIIHLSPTTCAALARLVSHPTRLACVAATVHHPLCPPGLESEAIGVVTLAHEEQHVDGITDEAKAQCYALQRADVVGRRLGLPARVAARIATFTKQSITQPPEYRSSECRRGGALDLHLPAGWPVGV